MVEDDWIASDPRSATQIQRDARQRAYRVIQLSQAWGVLLKAVFPRAVRLSIHPQPWSGDKLGIHMLGTRDAWLTPWHAVAVDFGHRVELMERNEAERIGAILVHQQGRASHSRAVSSLPGDPQGGLGTTHDGHVRATG